MIKKAGALLLATLALSVAGTSIVSAADNGELLIDQNNNTFQLVNGEYKLVPKGIQTRSVGFGESSASWVTTNAPNGYVVKHKGWKERKSSSSLYGVRACGRTQVSGNKYHYTKARMVNGLGITKTDSGYRWGNGSTYAASPYDNVHMNNSRSRTNWGGVY